jgi:hypothetical protein
MQPVGPPGPPSAEIEARMVEDARDAAVQRAYAPLSNRGERWRFSWLVRTQAGVAGLDVPGLQLGLGLLLGVGLPVPSSADTRDEHSLGYDGEVFFSGVGLGHRHRLAAAGRVGDRVGLFDQAAIGAAGYGITRPFGWGPSVGGRLGLAIGREFDYILAIGGDVDLVFGPTEGAAAVPMLSVSRLTLGAL